MAETIITKDGKCHTLLGSTTPVSIIRDYCGDEAADWVESNLDYMDRKELSDLGAYEADLDHLRRMMQDWVDDLKALCDLCENRKFTKATIAAGMRGVIYNIEKRTVKEKCNHGNHDQQRPSVLLQPVPGQAPV